MKKHVVEEMRAKGLTANEAEKAFDAVVEAIPTALRKHGTVRLPGVGTISKKYRDARTGRNPSTGETITIKGRDVAKFKASEGLV